MMAGSEVELTNDNFQDEVLQSDVPVLVDFWAPWCGPCHMMAPLLQELAEQYQGKVKVGKLNVDQAGEVASNYAITAIPTLLLFKGGEVVDNFIGVTPKDDLKKAMDAAL